MHSSRSPSYGIYLGDLDRRRTDSQGIISYALALTRAVSAALASQERLVVFCSRAVQDELGEIESAGRVQVEAVESPGGVIRRTCRQELAVVRQIARSGVKVIHFPKGRAPWRALPFTKVVATIHDDIPMQYQAGRFEARRRDLKNSYIVASLRRTLATADAVLTDSHFSLRQLRQESRSSLPIRVVVPGLTIETGCCVTSQVRGPRFVVFDSPLAHKRADEAASFAARYIIERRLTDHRVFLLGSGRGSAIRDRFPGLFEHEAGPIATGDVDELVRASRGVVIASRYEGLGLPALEAWARGTPAVVADCEAARELLSGIPGVYQGGDYASFARSLDEVLALEPASYERWSRVVHERCDWRPAAAEVLALYRELAA
jgi:glycosyltransferase involved in cell wall biosynthesis